MTHAGGIDRRSLARALSRVANASVAEVLGMSRGGAAGCRRTGITGSPGVGKSSLIARLARHRLRRPGALAIIAIDPTSPRSGGAILGDRIRMQELDGEPRIFIRSLASRVSQDGLTDNLPDILAVFEHAGFAELIVETVGVGQVGYAVRRVVDTNVLVSMPGEGDQIQAMKGGILETADICVVNKADLPGARQLAADLQSVVDPRGARAAGLDPAGHHGCRRRAGRRRAAWRCDRSPPGMARPAGPARCRRDRAPSAACRQPLARRTAEIIRTLPHEVLRQPLAATFAAVVSEAHRSCVPDSPAGDRGDNTRWQND